MLASAATCSWAGVHLLADEGGGGGAVSNLAVVGWALGGLLVLLAALWWARTVTRSRATGQAPNDLPDDYRRC